MRNKHLEEIKASEQHLLGLPQAAKAAAGEKRPRKKKGDPEEDATANLEHPDPALDYHNIGKGTLIARVMECNTYAMVRHSTFNLIQVIDAKSLGTSRWKQAYQIG